MKKVPLICQTTFSRFSIFFFVKCEKMCSDRARFLQSRTTSKDFRLLLDNLVSIQSNWIFEFETFFEEEEKQNPSKHCETNRSLSSVFSCFQRELLFYTTNNKYKNKKRDMFEQAFDDILSKRILSRLKNKKKNRKILWILWNFCI